MRPPHHPHTTRHRPLTTTLALAVALALLIPAALAGHPPPTPDPTLVRVDTGLLKGHHDTDHRDFLGIPYAAPPVGDLRWQPPHPPPPWTGTRDATTPGPRCAQGPGLGGTPASTAEDCLHLNVTTPPPTAHHHPAPVLVWIHGGGFTTGAGSDHDPRALAANGLVVVTLNYRLGALGFFGHPELPGSGTFGLADQQAALAWVRRNIAAFGGDPTTITLAGESAGGMSVCTHLTSPTARSLFHRAILQSGSCSAIFPRNALGPGDPGHLPWRSLTRTEEAGQRTTAALGCQHDDDPLRCLRSLDVTALTPHHDDFTQPAYGTPLIPPPPPTALDQAAVHRVPVLIGTTRDEMTGVASALHGRFDNDDYLHLLHDTFGPHADTVAAHYPAPAHPSPASAWAALNTARAVACPVLTEARAWANHVPTHTYEFADPGAPNPGHPRRPDVPLGASHASELGYLFDWGGVTEQLTPAQRRLAHDMVTYWTQFARHGDPNSPGAPTWPALHPSSPHPATLALAPGPTGIRLTDPHTTHHCHLWREDTPTTLD
ncbi:hypothetical protein C1701_24750 [Actinoalloteichus sp. AHMU CJ021]|uniref:carboxylesterase/lipase family protein n=1 Tax=Actinoalloteichus sp. AHMU CJ021 TaxID=2072503 RepID=UPI000CA01097|nr:hypothetical protein C1701_24750 [Actinoalloteichus sp. AHMU CJ021]